VAKRVQRVATDVVQQAATGVEHAYDATKEMIQERTG
jgi:hypothetical protein